MFSGIHTTDAMSCSFSHQTVKRVNRCPRNQLEWNSRATKFNCSSFNQSCVVDRSMFSYHCALNADVNELLELCAPPKFMHGQKCVEYNIRGTIIQESIINCSNATVPCPEAYKSIEAFKYQSCYDAVQLSEEEPKKTTLNCSTLRSGNSTSVLPASADDNIMYFTIFTVTLCIFTLCLHISLHIIMRWRRRNVRHDYYSREYSDCKTQTFFHENLNKDIETVEIDLATHEISCNYEKADAITWTGTGSSGSFKKDQGSSRKHSTLL